MIITTNPFSRVKFYKPKCGQHFLKSTYSKKFSSINVNSNITVCCFKRYQFYFCDSYFHPVFWISTAVLNMTSHYGVVLEAGGGGGIITSTCSFPTVVNFILLTDLPLKLSRVLVFSLGTNCISGETTQRHRAAG